MLIRSARRALIARPSPVQECDGGGLVTGIGLRARCMRLAPTTLATVDPARIARLRAIRAPVTRSARRRPLVGRRNGEADQLLDRTQQRHFFRAAERDRN